MNNRQRLTLPPPLGLGWSSQNSPSRRLAYHTSGSPEAAAVDRLLAEELDAYSVSWPVTGLSVVTGGRRDQDEDQNQNQNQNQNQIWTPSRWIVTGCLGEAAG
ncbi:hypothetical protein CH063_10917 [Colletotrichum higginsianum]|uniref:Uncharacterized protein n=1 Tax=Colletotrichum higginsianum (strain IMI 349063) TaxID=759273 RepID=H1VJB5_COLHI|nr:hypothetical protein CH63R_08748 [Colletotrichum higginsianum IMI 349063]OBR07227.1 hypothetical protein CH63R_08748 [Colletotrichum higginsianum IMI 349063]CCF40318.1 hypothetical protein CH063_10917 [Colletotrichum higginsianum]